MSLHDVVEAFIAEAAASGCPCEPGLLADLRALERDVEMGRIAEAHAIEAFELSCCLADAEVPTNVGLNAMVGLRYRHLGKAVPS